MEEAENSPTRHIRILLTKNDVRSRKEKARQQKSGEVCRSQSKSRKMDGKNNIAVTLLCAGFLLQRSESYRGRCGCP